MTTTTAKIEDPLNLCTPSQTRQIADSLAWIASVAPERIKSVRAQIVKRPSGSKIYRVHLVADYVLSAKTFGITASSLGTGYSHDEALTAMRAIHLTWSLI